jgi:hypothetical protein
MNRDDPIALLRALDPADEKDVDALVGRLAAVGTPVRALAQRPRRPGWTRRRAAWLLVASAAVAVMLAALVANPFSRSGAISSAQAKAQAASALDLTGGWHFTRISQYGKATGPRPPRFSKPLREDAWHAPDGTLRVSTRMGSGPESTTLFASSARRDYDPARKTVLVHRYVLEADMRAAERTYLPPSAADLYRAAYQLGKVRLAGVETLNGRKVYRLVFDWVGSSYTLIFDAGRRVPISSESRSPSGANDTFVTRVRYTAYERVQPGPALSRRLALPPAAHAAKTVLDPPIVIPAPVQGASATPAARAIAARLPDSFPPGAALGRARYVIVRHLPRGSTLAALVIPWRSPGRDCHALVEIPHAGGEAFISASGCGVGSSGSSGTLDGRTAIVFGGTKATKVALRFTDGGPAVRAAVAHGVFLASFPWKLTAYPFTIVSTGQDGAVTTQQYPLFAGGQLPTSVAH